MFKTSLEAPQLVSLLETFNFVLHEPEFEYEPDVKETVKRYLISLARVPRFSTITLFMSKDEKQLVKQVWDALDRVDDQVEGGVRKVWGVS
jgi:RNA polymerase II-associated protein 3